MMPGLAKDTFKESFFPGSVKLTSSNMTIRKHMYQLLWIVTVTQERIRPSVFRNVCKYASDF